MKEQTQGSRHAVDDRAQAARQVTTGVVKFGVFALVIAGTVGSALWAKRHAGRAPELAEVAITTIDDAGVKNNVIAPAPRPALSEIVDADRDDAAAFAGAPAKPQAPLYPEGTRFFDGRPIRPGKVMMMTVTAYSPDWRSCGDSADGITASTKSVYTNGGKMAAADTRVLPMNSMISVPGYAGNDVVPVLDRGGAIKGKRLDMLFPTHEMALKWGVRKVPVTVWEFADEPAKKGETTSASAKPQKYAGPKSL